MTRQPGIIWFSALLSIFLFCGDAVAANGENGPKPNDSTTLVKQGILTGVGTTLVVGSGLWLTSYHREANRGPFLTGAVLYGPVVVVGGQLLGASFFASAMLLNRTRPPGTSTTWRYPLLGSTLGAVAGTLGAIAIHNRLDDTSRLGWRSHRGRTAYLVGLPIALGMTTGALTGYRYQQQRTSTEEASETEATHRGLSSLSPVINTGHGSDDVGWTLGASLQF